MEKCQCENGINVKRGVTTALGVTKCQDGINFATAVFDNKACSLALYRKHESEPAYTVDLMQEDRFGDIASLCIENLPEDVCEYMYFVEGVPVMDPYAGRIVGRKEWGKPVPGEQIRCAFSFAAYDWEGDRPLERPYDQTVMYGLHVRGFTKHGSSGVKNKGTFEGITEKIPYFKELGVNLIELMPAYDFNEIVSKYSYGMEYKDFSGKQDFTINYWGYTAGQYFAPKASYAKGGDEVRAFKDMVRELHKNGIELVMELYFPADTKYNLIMDCVRFWVEEYHIDGVHVNCGETIVAALVSDPRLSRTKIMSSGFDISQVYQGDRIPYFKNYGELNDGFLTDMRRFLKGDEDQLDNAAFRMRRNSDKYAVINYIAGHNGFNLMDMVSYDVKHNEDNGENNRDGNNYNYSWNCGVEGRTRRKAVLELRRRQIKNALVMLFLSQGVPMLVSGDELGNSQRGNNNPYCQDNAVSWVEWSQQKNNEEIFAFTKELIAFRREHPILQGKRELRIMDYLSCGYPDISYHGRKAWYSEFENYNRQLGIMYCGKYAKDETGGEDDFFYFAYNMHWVEHEFALPSLPKNKRWTIAIDTGEAEKKKTTEIKNQRSIQVKGRTIVVLLGK